MLSKVDIFENAIFAFNGAFRITTLCIVGRED